MGSSDTDLKVLDSVISVAGAWRRYSAESPVLPGLRHFSGPAVGRRRPTAQSCRWAEGSISTIRSACERTALSTLAFG